MGKEYYEVRHKMTRRKLETREDYILDHLLQVGLADYMVMGACTYQEPILEVSSKQDATGIHGSINYKFVNVVPSIEKLVVGGKNWVNISGDFDNDEKFVVKGIGETENIRHDGSSFFVLPSTFGAIDDLEKIAELSKEELITLYPDMSELQIVNIMNRINYVKNIYFNNLNMSPMVIDEANINTPFAIRLIRATGRTFYCGSVQLESDNKRVPTIVCERLREGLERMGINAKLYQETDGRSKKLALVGKAIKNN